MSEPLTDATKLRVLALWFDKWDATAYADRQAILDDESNPGKNDVQRDLRRIAATLDAAPAPAGLDVERLSAAIHATHPHGRQLMMSDQEADDDRAIAILVALAESSEGEEG